MPVSSRERCLWHRFAEAAFSHTCFLVSDLGDLDIRNERSWSLFPVPGSRKGAVQTGGAGATSEEQAAVLQCQVIGSGPGSCRGADLKLWVCWRSRDLSRRRSR